MTTLTKLIHFVEELHINALRLQADQSQVEAFDRLESKIDVEDALKELTDVELDVVKMHYGIDYDSPKSFRQIGEFFGISQTKSKAIHNRALKKLRIFFKQI